MALVLCGVS